MQLITIRHIVRKRHHLAPARYRTARSSLLLQLIILGIPAIVIPRMAGRAGLGYAEIRDDVAPTDPVVDPYRDADLFAVGRAEPQKARVAAPPH